MNERSESFNEQLVTQTLSLSSEVTISLFAPFFLGPNNFFPSAASQRGEARRTAERQARELQRELLEAS